MKRHHAFPKLSLLMLVGSLLGATTANSASRYSVASGNWSSTTTWSETSGGGSGASVPASGDIVTIEGGCTVTLDVSTASTISSITISAGATFTTTNANAVRATTITVNGTYLNGSSGTITLATMTVNNGGTYQHNINAGTIPTTTWNTGSTCLITGTTNTVPGGLSQSFHHFTWNCPNQSKDLSLGDNLTTVNGDLSVASTGLVWLRLKSGSVDATTRVNGGYNQRGGVFIVKASSSGTGTLTVKGFSLTGGMFDMATSGASVLNVGGDFSVTGAGLFTRSDTALTPASVNFNGTNLQNFTNSGSMQGTIKYTVTSGATLLMGGSSLTGAGNFTLNSGAGLGIGDSNGITPRPTASGNIQVAGTRNFDANANYIYNGTAAQVTGSGLPTILTGNVTNANSAGLSLTANETINTPGVFAVNSGAVMTMGTTTINGSGTFTLASGGTLASGHANGINGNITVSGTKTLSTGANYLYNGTAAQAAGALLPATVNSLTINNTAGAVTLSQVTTVTTSVTLASGAKLGLPSGTSIAATLSIAGVNQASGTWGNTGSGAANIDSAHFAGSGVLKVGSGTTSSTALAASLNPSTYGSPVTFTATVIGTGPKPTGTVTFKEGSTTLGAGTLDSSGVATFVISTLPVAGSPHSITAVYGGDGNFGSSSGNVTQGVLPRLSGGLASGSLSGYKGSGIKVVFVAKDSAGAALETNEVQLATANGGSSFTYAIGVPPNTATLSLKPGFYLRKRVSVPPAIATANEVTLDITWTFLGGDADGNNQVDGNDYAWIRALWGQTSNPQYDINGDGRTNADDFPDLNGDGVIDALDYAVLKDGWYQQGDPQ